MKLYVDGLPEQHELEEIQEAHRVRGQEPVVSRFLQIPQGDGLFKLTIEFSGGTPEQQQEEFDWWANAWRTIGFKTSKA